MFITSYESIVGLLYLLLSVFGGVVIFALILGRLIVNYPGWFFKLLEISFELFCATLTFFVVKLLRLLTLQYFFSFLSHLLEEHYLGDKAGNNRRNFKKLRHGNKLSFSERIARKLFVVMSFSQANSMIYGCFLFGLLGILFMLPGSFGVEEMAIIVVFSLLVIDKISALKRTKSLIQEAKQFENSARRAYHNERLYDTLAQYHKALDIYKMPLLVKNPRLDAKRAKLLEKIGVALYKEVQLDKALMRFNQALDIYKKTHIADEPTFLKDRVRVLKNSAIILRQLGRRNEALIRYQLISKLTGKPAVPKDLFAV